MKMSASTMAPIVELPRFAARAAWADRIIHAGLVYSMAGSVWRAIAVRNGEIVALPIHVDELEGLIAPDTVVTEASDLTVLPALYDAHEHMTDAAKNVKRAPVGDARSIADFLALVQAASATAHGDEWAASRAKSLVLLVACVGQLMVPRPNTGGERSARDGVSTSVGSSCRRRRGPDGGRK
jgi:imidazolonepropionase-like amidohydrolase